MFHPASRLHAFQSGGPTLLPLYQVTARPIASKANESSEFCTTLGSGLITQRQRQRVRMNQTNEDMNE